MNYLPSIILALSVTFSISGFSADPLKESLLANTFDKVDKTNCKFLRDKILFSNSLESNSSINFIDESGRVYGESAGAEPMKSKYSFNVEGFTNHGINITIDTENLVQQKMISYESEISGWTFSFERRHGNILSFSLRSYLLKDITYNQWGYNSKTLPRGADTYGLIVSGELEKVSLSFNIGGEHAGFFVNGKLDKTLASEYFNIWGAGRFILETPATKNPISNLSIYSRYIDKKLARYFNSKNVLGLIDTDFDGLFNGEEINRKTDPNLADSDGDFLCDGDELKIHFSNPMIRDSDDDGFSDLCEVLSKSKPNRKNSVPQLIPKAEIEKGRIMIKFPSSSKLKYRVISSPDFSEWTPFGKVIVGDGDIKSFSTDPLEAHLFYRIELAK